MLLPTITRTKGASLKTSFAVIIRAKVAVGGKHKDWSDGLAERWCILHIDEGNVPRSDGPVGATQTSI